MHKIITEIPDPVGDAIKIINQCGGRMAERMSVELTMIMEAGIPINNILWSDPRIGTNGVVLLQKLGTFVGVLAAHFPEKMNAVLASAGQNLVPHEDGTVTYTPPSEEV